MNKTGPSLGILNAPLGLSVSATHSLAYSQDHLPDLTKEDIDDKSPEKQEYIV
jgi:hypothetical protein